MKLRVKRWSTYYFGKAPHNPKILIYNNGDLRRQIFNHRSRTRPNFPHTIYGNDIIIQLKIDDPNKRRSVLTLSYLRTTARPNVYRVVNGNGTVVKEPYNETG